jgi:hypothetical protein
MVFLLGYIIGKHQGWKKGYKQAEVVIPLEMRQQSLENGRCIICAELWANTRKCEIYSRELDTL